MIINTRYSLGNSVVGIGNCAENVWHPCPACNGTGTVSLNDDRYTCPKCYGRSGEYRYGPALWRITEISEVGQVRTEYTSTRGWDDMLNEPARAQKSIIQYMLESTGVGSGTLWPERDLFFNKESAQAECDRRNEAAAATSPS